MATAAWLIPVSGPPMNPIEIPAKDQGLIMGRHESCDLKFPPDADKVSRQHARLIPHGSKWRIADMNSRWGTFLNGVKLNEGRELPISEGDLIRIAPWTFSFSASPPKQKAGLHTKDDMSVMGTMVRSVRAEDAGPMAEDLLSLLLECAGGIHAAPDEKSLAQVLLDSAVRGTGLPNAVLLRPVDSSGLIEIIASKVETTAHGAAYSRALIAAAENGNVAELADAGTSESIISNRIDAAICVPIMLGATVAAFLYLDSRSDVSRVMRKGIRANAAAFCVALGKMASLALANLKRIDIERRQALMEAELSAGTEAQRWIMPKRSASFGPFKYTGESRPGRYVGGDFFDVIDLGDGRVAVALGDVSGKGVGASVLMTAAQGFLHASLVQHADVAKAVSALNAFVIPRRPESRFITLWVGIFDMNKKSLSCVDAGHGYAMLANDGKNFVQLEEGGGVPIGVEADWKYKAGTLPLKAGGRFVVVSDGIIEQFGIMSDGKKEQFQVEGTQQCLANAPEGADAVEALFAAVVEHAGSANLADDATVVLVSW
jgi:phosphoserine phosphatase RsbU/P